MEDDAEILLDFGTGFHLPFSSRLSELEMDTDHDFLSFFEETFPCTDFAKEIDIEGSPINETRFSESSMKAGPPFKELEELDISPLCSIPTTTASLSALEKENQIDLVTSPVNYQAVSITCSSPTSSISDSQSFGSPSDSIISSASSENLAQTDEDSQVPTNGNCKRSKGDTGKYNHKALTFPPCCVCGGKASGLHYGVNSCEACKGFFRRYLLRHEDYKCSKGGKCVITSRHRGNCSGCRLTKCLALGMSKDASRLGRYTLSRRTKTIMDVKELEKKDKSGENIEEELSKLEELETISHSLADKERVYKIHPRDEIFQKTIKTVLSTHSKDIQEKKYIHNLMKTLMKSMHEIKPFGEITTQKEINERITTHYEKYKLKVEMFGRLKAVPDDEYYAFLKNYGIDLDGRWAVLKRSKHELEGVVERYVHFAKQVPGFASLSVNDQANLLKVARCDFFMILMHRGYIHKHQVFLTHNGMPYHLEEAADKFFSRELIIAILDMYHRWQQLDLNEEEMALLISVSLTFSDRCKLENRAQVEKIQYTMTELLNKSLVRRCKDTARRRFAKMIDLFVMMRDCSEQYYKEYKKLCDNELIVEEVPMMMELLLEDY